MKREKKRLFPPKSVPLLAAESVERIRFEDFERYKEDRNLWKKRWYRIYFFTAGIAVLLAICVLILCVGEQRGGLLSSLFSGYGDVDFSDPPSEDSSADALPNDSTQDVWVPVDPPGDNPPKEENGKPESPLTPEKLYSFDYSAVPSGAHPIVPMDLSLTTYGAGYIQNFTGFSPDTEALLQGSLKKAPTLEYLASSDKPRVLILHTHGTESYSAEGAISYTDDGADVRSENAEESVVAVGKALADALEARGISTIHCTVLHDRVQYKDSYARAEETIKEYLAKYPSILLVIDLHRDSIIKSTGEMVRPVTLNQQGEATAQVMCVVGSSWGGEQNDRWEGNLALALKLRAELNGTTSNLCRPPYLREATYNQEFAPYSLLLEIGASGNSLNEAKRAALLVADALAKLIPQM